MREPCAIVRDALAYVGSKIRPGITTAELDRLAEEYIRSRGAIPSCLGYCGYPASICASVNEEIVHGIPGERVLRAGDIVSIDLCAYKNGFHGDGARTCPVGEAHPRYRRMLLESIGKFACRHAPVRHRCRGAEACGRERFFRRARVCRPRDRQRNARRSLRPEFRKTRYGYPPERGDGHLRRTDDFGGLARIESACRRLDGCNGGRKTCGALRKHAGNTGRRGRDPYPVKAEMRVNE